MKRAIFALLPALLLTAATATTPPATGVDAANYLDHFIDPSVDPRNDFFHYAVGKWLKENPIPANERSWGFAHVVQKETYRRMMAINEESATNRQAPRGSNTQKISDFWFAAMDTTTIAKQGFAPLEPEFARIEAVKDRQGLL